MVVTPSPLTRNKLCVLRYPPVALIGNPRALFTYERSQDGQFTKKHPPLSIFHSFPRFTSAYTGFRHSFSPSDYTTLSTLLMFLRFHLFEYKQGNRFALNVGRDYFGSGLCFAVVCICAFLHLFPFLPFFGQKSEPQVFPIAQGHIRGLVKKGKELLPLCPVVGSTNLGH